MTTPVRPLRFHLPLLTAPWLVGSSNTTVTRRLPQAGHMRRNSRRDNGKFGRRAHEGVDVELLSVDAFPNPLHSVARAVGAPHVHLPAEASPRQHLALVSPSPPCEVRFTG